MAALTGAPVLGWATPVPVDTRKLRNYRRGDLLVSLAGIGANAVLVLVFTAVLAILHAIPAQSETLDLLYKMGVRALVTNVGLILFNLLPIPPLDGSRVALHLLPASAANQLRALFPYGFMILWGLVIVGALDFLGGAVWGISQLFIDLASRA
jgi:Zn-dependent protease